VLKSVVPDYKKLINFKFIKYNLSNNNDDRMRRIIHIIFIIILIPKILSGQTLENREKKIVSQNKILSKTQWDYSYVKGVVNKQGTKISITKYNKTGDIIEENLLNNKGIVTGWEKYEYDANGNKTLYERSGNSGKYSKAYKYDEKNNLILEAGFNGAENFRNSFTYLPSNKLESLTYSVNNKIEEKRQYNYSGNTCIISIYAQGQTLSSKLKLLYDNRSNVIEETLLNLDNKETEKKLYKYNSILQITEEEKNQGGVLNYRITYIYDLQGNLLSVSEETKTNKKYIKKSFTYDSLGNLTEYKWRRAPDDEFNIKSYTYNSKGICISEHTFYPNTKFELLSKYEYEFY
jgi:hypothetical protein